MRAKTRQFEKERQLLMQRIKRKADFQGVHPVYPTILDPLQWIDPSTPDNLVSFKSNLWKKERLLLHQDMDLVAYMRDANPVYPDVNDTLDWISPTPLDELVFPCAYWDYHDELFGEY